MRFEGIYTPVITPMGPDREIDENGWVQVIEHLLGQGMHGLVLGGTTGENYALTREERIRQFHFGHEVIAVELQFAKRSDALVEKVANDLSLNANQAVCLSMAFRFLKRVNAHLGNIASSVVMPLHKIDYFDEKWNRTQRKEAPGKEG